MDAQEKPKSADIVARIDPSWGILRRDRRSRQKREPELASFFWGGFECSTHCHDDGLRLDLLRATGHDATAEGDYRLLLAHGLRVARDGVRWNLVKSVGGRYDWSSVLPLMRAAGKAGIQVVWDLCHYGWPDHVDIWRPEFVGRFAKYSAAFAPIMRAENGRGPVLHSHQRNTLLGMGGRQRRHVQSVRDNPRAGTEAATGACDHRRDGRDQAGRCPGTIHRTGPAYQCWCCVG
jgi:hypothetical protein